MAHKRRPVSGAAIATRGMIESAKKLARQKPSMLSAFKTGVDRKNSEVNRFIVQSVLSGALDPAGTGKIVDFNKLNSVLDSSTTIEIDKVSYNPDGQTLTIKVRDWKGHTIASRGRNDIELFYCDGTLAGGLSEAWILVGTELGMEIQGVNLGNGCHYVVMYFADYERKNRYTTGFHVVEVVDPEAHDGGPIPEIEEDPIDE